MTWTGGEWGEKINSCTFHFEILRAHETPMQKENSGLLKEPCVHLLAPTEHFVPNLSLLIFTTLEKLEYT